MALPATHIRFALAIADRSAITDTEAYLSGTLYPDSRWVTGIGRGQTHASRCLQPDFPSDDFTLGWHVHCLCDRIQEELFDGLLEGLSELTPGERWERISAAKVVQDMHDAARGGIRAHVSELKRTDTPNGESAERVAFYLGLVRRTYGHAAAPDWSDYRRLWADVGLTPQGILRIAHQMAHILADSDLVAKLHGVFDRMVDRWSAWRAADTQGDNRS